MLLLAHLGHSPVGFRVIGKTSDAQAQTTTHTHKQTRTHSQLLYRAEPLLQNPWIQWWPGEHEGPGCNPLSRGHSPLQEQKLPQSQEEKGLPTAVLAALPSLASGSTKDPPSHRELRSAIALTSFHLLTLVNCLCLYKAYAALV